MYRKIRKEDVERKFIYKTENMSSITGHWLDLLYISTYTMQKSCVYDRDSIMITSIFLESIRHVT